MPVLRPGKIRIMTCCSKLDCLVHHSCFPDGNNECKGEMTGSKLHKLIEGGANAKSPNS